MRVLHLNLQGLRVILLEGVRRRDHTVLKGLNMVLEVLSSCCDEWARGHVTDIRRDVFHFLRL